MSITETGMIMEDIYGVIASATRDDSSFNSEYGALIHTPDDDIEPYLLKIVETMRNYNKYVGDYVVVTMEIMGGVFIKDIYPHRDSLEISIVRTNKSNLKIHEEKRYKAILINNNKNVYGSEYTSSTKEELNRRFMVTAEFQCLDLVVEGLRAILVDGIYESVLLKDVIQAEFTEKINNLAINGEVPDVNIDIVEPVNNNEIKQLVVPTGVKILDFPSYLQNTIYGVYNAGLGTYVQTYNDKPTIFVYPLFDVNRFDMVDKKMIVYFTPNVKFDHIETTYDIDGDILKVLAGTNLKSEDDAENEFIDQGDSYIRVKPDLMMNRNVMTSTSGMTLDSDTQVEGLKFKERRDGMSIPTYLGLESNVYKHRSMTARKALASYSFVWYYSKPDLIYPGMPLKYVYEDRDGGIKELLGVVQATATVVDIVKGTRSTYVVFYANKPIVVENNLE